jgi:CheY-like chemotaxis protein
MNYGEIASFSNCTAVLLVEDDDQIRVVVESYLEELGHKVLSAGAPQEALAFLNTAPQIDLLFTDVELTGDREAGLKLEQVRAMSALPPKADTDQHGRNVRFVPKADDAKQ